jgi:enolase
MPTAIRAVKHQLILNSHGIWTTEFTIELADGRVGRGAAPQGETPSSFEDCPIAIPVPVADIQSVLNGKSFSQRSLDRLLAERRAAWGSQAIYALSTAFFACESVAATPSYRPRLLFNIVNGGRHARTNPVAADITEVLLVSRTDDIAASIEAYLRLNVAVCRELAELPARIVGGHRVHDLGKSAPNERAVTLVAELVERHRLSTTFGVMIDASAGDWFDGQKYRLPVTGGDLEPGELVEYWQRFVERQPVAILEDPFAEHDFSSWQSFSRTPRGACLVFADNFTSTMPGELAAKAAVTDGVIVKPDQNGTVTGTREFTRLARAANLHIAASHRSIETDTDALIRIAIDLGIQYIKIGPYSDFSAVARTNTLLRLLEPA